MGLPSLNSLPLCAETFGNDLGGDQKWQLGARGPNPACLQAAQGRQTLRWGVGETIKEEVEETAQEKQRRKVKTGKCCGHQESKKPVTIVRHKQKEGQGFDHIVVPLPPPCNYI